MRYYCRRMMNGIFATGSDEIVLNDMLQTAQEPESRPMSPREARARQANTAFGRILRYGGLILGIYLGWQLGITIRPEDSGGDLYGYPVIVSASLGALFFMLAPYLTIGIFSRMRHEVGRIEASDLVAGGAGLLIGGLVSTLFAFPLAMLPNPFGQYVPVLALLVICSISVISTLTKKRELMDLVGFQRRISEGPSQADSAPAPVAELPELLLDTSAIIDGRVRGLSLAGFLPFRLVVPQFVLHELQMVADSDDYSKRTRGVRGLQALEEMRSHPEIDLDVRHIDAEGKDVDGQLVTVAKSLGIPVLSGDTNLERVAALQEVRVLNLHSLADLMRPALAVGDSTRLKIVQPGREYQQGVGFLDDGTMVVVDGGEPLVGESANVVITRTLQTSSGRMMFARLDSPESPS
ncbi:MAG: PIN domain-containing protein [Thermomicrobiaceae bacterium]